MKEWTTRTGRTLFSRLFLSLLVVGVFTSLFSHAKESRVDSEYFWMAYAGETIIYPEFSYMYISREISYKLPPFNKQSIGGSTFKYTLSAEHGLLNGLSVGGRFGYGHGATDQYFYYPGGLGPSYSQTTTSAGFEDIEFYSKFRYDFSKGALHAGASFSLSPDRRRYFTIEETNRFTGQNKGMVYLGFEYPIQNFLLGFRVDGDVFRSDGITENAVGIQTTTSKGLERRFGIFTELLFNSFQLGVSGSYLMKDPETSSSPFTTATSYPATTGFQLRAYSAIALTPQINILPGAGYSTTLSREVGTSPNLWNIDTDAIFNLDLGIRFAF